MTSASVADVAAVNRPGFSAQRVHRTRGGSQKGAVSHMLHTAQKGRGPGSTADAQIKAAFGGCTDRLRWFGGTVDRGQLSGSPPRPLGFGVEI